MAVGKNFSSFLGLLDLVALETSSATPETGGEYKHSMGLTGCSRETGQHVHRKQRARCIWREDVEEAPDRVADPTGARNH